MATDELEKVRAGLKAQASPGPDRALSKNGSALRLGWDPVDVRPVLTGERVTQGPTVLARTDGVRLAYPKRLNLLMGETESGKTWAALHGCCQELEVGNHVLFVDYEDAIENLVDRLLALGATPAAIATNFSYIDGPPVFDELAAGLLGSLFSSRGAPSLAVYDGVTAAMSALGLDPDRGVDVARFYNGGPRWLAEAGCAVLLVDHVAKDREARGRWAIGSERKISGLDGAAYSLEIVKPFGRERTGEAKLLVSKDRVGHIRQHEGPGRAAAKFELVARPGGNVSAQLHPPVGGDKEGRFRPTVLMERVSRTLEASTKPLSARGVRVSTVGKASVLDLALELLVNEGFVTTEPGPRGSSLHRSITPFRATEGGLQYGQ